MILTERHKRILNAELCPYCNSETERTTEIAIYGQEYSGRDVIMCKNYPSCDAYVGCHKSGEPLGRLANKKLRKAKIEAHKHFDKLWREDHISRSDAYKLLSNHLGVPPEYTHIGMFSIKTLEKVSNWSKLSYKIIIDNGGLTKQNNG